MKLDNIINSVTTNIGYSDEEIRNFILECMSKFCDDGFIPKYLICNPKDLKVIKYIFRDCKAEDKNSYNTDFGLLMLIPMKEKTIGYITITDKDYI